MLGEKNGLKHHPAPLRHVLRKPVRPGSGRVPGVAGAPKWPVLGQKPPENPFHHHSGKTWKLCAQWAKNPQNFWGGCMPLWYSRESRALEKHCPVMENCVVSTRFLCVGSAPQPTPPTRWIRPTNVLQRIVCLWKCLVYPCFLWFSMRCCTSWPE